MKRTLATFAWTLGVAGLFLAGCQASPTGPVSPGVVESPRTSVVIDPRLEKQLAVPNANQTFSFTDSNHLKYSFQLQNTTNVPIALRYRVTFFDDSDHAPVVVRFGLV